MSTIADVVTAGFSRRRFLATAGSSIAVLGRLAPAADRSVPRSTMGLASNCWDLHQKAQVAKGGRGDLSDPQAFLERCHQLGAGGMQAPLGVRDEQYCSRLRQWAEAREMFVEGSINLSSNRFDAERFQKELLTAKAAGAAVVRTVVIPGRRYEQFSSAEEFARFSQRALERLQLVEPILARHRMRLAVENHKDHRVDERLALLKQVSSEWVGVCVDTGNSFALCEDPMDVVRAYAPFAFSVHVRDHAVERYEEGFLFGETALGQGFFDVPAMVRVLREARPEVHFNLEVITRDALRVPVLTPKYWVTMPTVPATDLVRTLRTVNDRTSQGPLLTVGSLPLEQQVQCEQRIVEESLAYARERLQF